MHQEHRNSISYSREARLSSGTGFTKTPSPHSTQNSLTPKSVCVRNREGRRLDGNKSRNSSWEISSGSRGNKMCHLHGRKGTPDPQPSTRGKTQHSQCSWKVHKSKESVSLQQHRESSKNLVSSCFSTAKSHSVINNPEFMAYKK